jgi:hypothetical protein
VDALLSIWQFLRLPLIAFLPGVYKRKAMIRKH